MCHSTFAEATITITCLYSFNHCLSLQMKTKDTSHCIVFFLRSVTDFLCTSLANSESLPTYQSLQDGIPFILGLFHVRHCCCALGPWVSTCNPHSFTFVVTKCKKPLSLVFNYFPFKVDLLRLTLRLKYRYR